MSDHKIIPAVSAVVAAFHNGAEIFKLVKKKRRAARKYQDLAQQEWEEKQLQSSLIAGEKQISLRYERDQRELGDFMRIGDDAARERLYHIASMVKSEIIDTLNLAAKNKFCTLNLRLLHEASITNRKDALRALDELKQRIYVRMHTVRPMKRVGGESRTSQSRTPAQILQRSSYDTMRALPSGYALSIANSPAHTESRELRKETSEYFQTSGRRSPLVDLRSIYTPTPIVDPNLHAALDEFRPTHRASLLREIQLMISSYQDFNIDNGMNSQSNHMHDKGNHPARRDTLVSLNDRALFDQNRRREDRNYIQSLNQESAGHSITRSASVPSVSQNTHGSESEHPAYDQHYDTSEPYSHLQAQKPPARWSGGSVSSSAISNTASLHRNSSHSSQGSITEVPPPPPPPKSPRRLLTISVPNGKTDLQDNEGGRTSGSYSPYTSARASYTSSPIKELAPLRTRSDAHSVTPSRYDAHADAKALSPTAIDPNLPTHMPWPGDEDSRAASPVPQYSSPQSYTSPVKEAEVEKEEEVEARKPSHHQHKHSLSIPTEHCRPSIYSESIYSDTHEQKPPSPSNTSAFAAANSPFVSLKTMMGFRHNSISPSVASTDSNTSFSIGVLPGRLMRTSIIRTDSLASRAYTQASDSSQMLNGRPNKENDYWGFCKGAWAMREDPKKGIQVRSQPLGYYNSRQMFACKSCAFSGEVFKAPHPTKKGKTVDVIDPSIRESKSGIRYRWIFLAKSHVKKKIADPKAHSWSDDNFGCIICCMEGNVSSVYGGVDTLLDHVARVHVADMSERTRQKVNCILGRVAGENEDWDINVPIFGSVESS